MSKDIKDYLFLYLGCEVEYGYEGSKKIGTLTGKNDLYGWEVWDRSALNIYHKVRDELIKPILRQLGDATTDEIKEIEDSRVFVKATPVHIVGNMQWTPETFRLALSKHFDLFNLIPEGLAIDKTTLNQQ